MASEKMKIQTAIIIGLLAISALLTLNSITPTKGSPETVVYVEPDAITGLMPPENFTIYVKIANVTNLYGIDIQFTWDPTIIRYVSHQKHIPVDTYPDGILHSPTIPVKDQVDENASMPGSEPGTRYWLAESSMLPAAPFNGSGIIFEMTFQVVGLGTSPLHIVACTLADNSGNPITYTAHDGYFQNYVPPPANIFVNPPSIINSSLEPCQNFSISINITGIQNLYSFDLWLGYNASIIEVVDVSVNPIFPPPIITQTTGQLEISASLIPPSPPINGDLYLAVIKFHILAKGESILDLHDITLLDDQGQPITYTEQDGYFNNMLITRMFVNPPEIIDPTLKPGDMFSVYVAIENAIGMYGYEFKLSYDTNILTCLGPHAIPPNNETHFDVEIEVNDTIGVLWFKVQYYPPAEPIDIYEAKSVVEIPFMIQDYGQTVLDLYDADITDESGVSLSPVVEDGFFATLLRDVAILSINITSSNKVYPGRNVTIDVVAMNRGNMTTETFNVTLYANMTVIGLQSVTLDPWSNTTLTFQWNTTGLTPCSNFTIWAEASTVPYEINTGNNVMHDGWVKIKMLGDVNGDGIIDILDIVEVSAAYGSIEGDPNWNPDADVAAPWGYIDILDLVTVSSRYGQHC